MIKSIEELVEHAIDEKGLTWEAATDIVNKSLLSEQVLSGGRKYNVVKITLCDIIVKDELIDRQLVVTLAHHQFGMICELGDRVFFEN